MNRFSLSGRNCIITGGLGLLGLQHAMAVSEAGGHSILLDIDSQYSNSIKENLKSIDHIFIPCDVSSKVSVLNAFDIIKGKYKKIDALINNAALNPKANDLMNGESKSRLEAYSIELFHKECAVGLTGSLICCQVFGSDMANAGGGVILNIASDLGVIAPDQRLYGSPGDDAPPVKPVSYSVIKHGLIGLTRYIATYWPHKNIRCNALLPGGVYDGQPDSFVEKVSNLIPMGRMANRDEYQGAIQFLLSDASSYMNGGLLVIDGGRTCW